MDEKGKWHLLWMLAEVRGKATALGLDYVAAEAYICMRHVIRSVWEGWKEEGGDHAVPGGR